MPRTHAATLPARLVVARGSPLPDVAFERPGSRLLGRGSDCDVALDDAAVSRHHARLDCGADGLTVVDLDSAKGVWLNGVRLEANEPAVLHDRDLLAIHPWAFLVRLGPEDADSDHPLPEPKPAQKAAPAPRSGPSASPAPPAAAGPASADPYRTRPSIFLRLKADGSVERQLGWTEFSRVYGPVIAGFARNAGLKPQEVDDVLQDVMLGFFRVVDSFEYDPSKGRFRGYLKRVTLNAIRSRHRRRRPQQNLPEEFEPPAATSDLEVAWEREWTEQLLRRALEEVRGSVQEKTMQAFELYGVQGMPAAEVSKMTGMTEAAIRHAKMRVLDQLRESIARYREDEG
ncbi:MAG: sigma-70 family RNA polymerase sigma factor [Phycisphaerales bacterium]